MNDYVNPKHACVIVAASVIVEDDKVLMVKDHGPDGFWKFPGGQIEATDASFEETAKRETREELGFEVDILRPIQPMMVSTPRDDKIVLIHYLAVRLGEVQPSQEVVEWAWFSVEDLPLDCAPNITSVIETMRNFQKTAA